MDTITVTLDKWEAETINIWLSFAAERIRESRQQYPGGAERVQELEIICDKIREALDHA